MASPDYDVAKFIDDPAFLSDVVRYDLPLLGDVAGLRGVHLQCHIGTDTLYLLKVAGQSGFRVRQQNHDGVQQHCAVGDPVRIRVPSSAIRVLPA